jgi:SAM-dependent methyltransferase
MNMMDETPRHAELRELMRSHFQVANLVGISEKRFRERIEEFCSLDSAELEGYADEGAHQRDLSVRFAWGHNHDFGSFQKHGLMGNRHIALLATFHNWDALPADLTGKNVLDIGVWTGGTSLLFSALGADVLAVEEVVKYAQCVDFLSDCFAAHIDVRSDSLYSLQDMDDEFDLVHLSGVLYHVSDPILALRIAYNALKEGGTLLLETHALAPRLEPVLVYHGPTKTVGGPQALKERRRVGWNWFVPSPQAVHQMLRDVGFETVETSFMAPSRLGAVARKGEHRDMLRAGLARRDIR